MLYNNGDSDLSQEETDFLIGKAFSKPKQTHIHIKHSTETLPGIDTMIFTKDNVYRNRTERAQARIYVCNENTLPRSFQNLIEEIGYKLFIEIDISSKPKDKIEKGLANLIEGYAEENVIPIFRFPRKKVIEIYEPAPAEN